MSRELTEADKEARRQRARRRREAKAAGTYVPRSQRKEVRKSQQQAAYRAHAPSISPSASLRRGEWDDSIPRPVFSDGEPVLVKAVITGVVYPDSGGLRYTVKPVEGPRDIDKWQGEVMVRQSHLARWPRKQKRSNERRR